MWMCLCDLTEVSNHPGIMATQLWQSTQTLLKNSQGGLRGRMKEEENNNTIKSCRGDISGLLHFCKKRWLWVHFILSRSASLRCLCLCLRDALDHYHVPPTRFRMKLRNSEPGCDIQSGCVTPAQSESCNSYERVSLIEQGWKYVWKFNKTFFFFKPDVQKC